MSLFFFEYGGMLNTVEVLGQQKRIFSFVTARCCVLHTVLYLQAVQLLTVEHVFLEQMVKPCWV